MPYFVYLLRCKDGSIYTGTTNDLERRFKEHKTRTGGRYTRSHEVREMVYVEEYPTRSEALRREAEIKGWRREKKIKLING